MPNVVPFCFLPGIIIIGDKVDVEIASWNFGIIIVQFCTAPAIRKDGIPYCRFSLRNTIHSSKDSIIPKMPCMVYIPDDIANNSFFFLFKSHGTNLKFCCAKSITVLPFLKVGLDQHGTFEPCDLRPSTLSSRDCLLRILKTFQEPWYYKDDILCKIADFQNLHIYGIFRVSSRSFLLRSTVSLLMDRFLNVFWSVKFLTWPFGKVYSLCNMVDLENWLLPRIFGVFFQECFCKE